MPEKFSQVLPPNWDGRFPFSNDSKEDFVFQWAKKQYLFPAGKTVDMCRMIVDATPIEIQQIRKVAARQFGEREFFKSQQAKNLESIERNADGSARLASFTSARSYSENELKEYIQKCLRPFPEDIARVSPAPDLGTEDKLHKDEVTGDFVSKPPKSNAQSLDPGGILIN